MPGVMVSQHGGEHTGFASQCSIHSGGVELAKAAGVLTKDTLGSAQAPIKAVKQIIKTRLMIFLEIRYILLLNFLVSSIGNNMINNHILMNFCINPHS